jgi:pimeloyl-ACP methyl ester carboxylesterase
MVIMLKSLSRLGGQAGTPACRRRWQAAMTSPAAVLQRRRAMSRRMSSRVQALMLAAAEHAPALGARMVASHARRVPERVRATRPRGHRPAVVIPIPVPGVRRHARGRLAAVTELHSTAPVVFLLEGHCGRGQLRHFVEPITEAGFLAVTVHVPAHWPGGPVRYAPGILPDFTQALTAAAGTYGTPFAIVAHSLGAYAAQHAALDALRSVPCLALIDPMPDAQAITKFLLRRHRLDDRIQALLPRLLTRQAGLTLEGADVVSRAREDNEPHEVLVVYDDGGQDRHGDPPAVEPARSLELALAWGATPYRTSASHRGMLSDRRVQEAVIAHLNAAASRHGLSSRLRPGPAARPPIAAAQDTAAGTAASAPSG